MANLVSDRTAQQIKEMLGRVGRAGISRPNDPRDLGPVGELFVYTRFRLDWKTRFEVLVNAGIATRNGTFKFTKGDTVITGVGNDSDGFAETFDEAVKHYAWLEFTADYDPDLAPDGMLIVCGKTAPANDSANRNKRKYLGEFMVDEDDGDYIVLKSSLVRYWIGDTDDVIAIPDAQATGTGTQFKSIDWRGGEGGKGQWELYGMSHIAATPKSIYTGFQGGETGYDIVVRDNATGRIHYATITDDEPSPPAGVQLEVVVDVRYDEDSYKLQYRTKTITVLGADEEPGDWITFHEAAECEEEGTTSGPSQAIPEGSTQRYVPPA